MDDPDLLYEDLFENLQDGRAIIKTSVHEMEDRIKDLSHEAEQLTLRVRNLQEQNEELSKQNEILVRNISCLFKTAQMEISRKDKQIRSLQQESLNASTSGCRFLMPAAESICAGKQQPETASAAFSHDERKRVESAVMVSKAETKGKEGKSSLIPVNAAWKQARQAGARHQNCVELFRGNGKDSDRHQDGVELSRGNGKGSDRHQDGVELSRGNGKDSDRHQDGVELSRGNDKGSDRHVDVVELSRGNGKGSDRHLDVVELSRGNGKGNGNQSEMRKRRRSDEMSREGYERRRGNERYPGARTVEGDRRSSFNGHRASENNRERQVCS